ncbi:MAG: hypothetical protein HPY45_09835 [Anaerolineae bacterium]|nr:hypothetical protein [Anaerolineae bacterium]
METIKRKFVLDITDDDIDLVAEVIKACYPGTQNDIVARSLAESETMLHALILTKALRLMMLSPHFRVEFGFAVSCKLLAEAIEQINILMDERPILRQELIKQGVNWPGLENNTT